MKATAVGVDWGMLALGINNVPRKQRETNIRSKGPTQPHGEHAAISNVSVEVRRDDAFHTLGPSSTVIDSTKLSVPSLVGHVVVVEDEQEIQALIIGALREEGHTVEALDDGRAALDRRIGPGARQPNLIVLDLMLPNVDGLAITREVRRTRVTPILMLTAKSTELDRVLGLELGADDYLTKPFSIRELQARVGAILRRVEMMRVQSRVEEDTEQRIDHGDLRIDPTRREVLVNGLAVALTAREFDLLYLLASNPGRAFSRDYLLERLWRDGFEGFNRTVDTHSLRVRRKLGGAGTVAERVVTLWGVGYKDERPESSARATP